MTTLVHGLDEVLGKFKLIAGAGSEESGEACTMTALAWQCGEGWTDAMPCCHRLIRSVLIGANDGEGSTQEQRAELVRLGQEGAIDTWWIPGEVLAFSLRLEDDEDSSRFARACRMLERIAAWKGNKERPVLSGADLRGAVLSGADLSDADLRGAWGTPWGGMPAGWEQSEGGLWIPETAEAAA